MLIKTKVIYITFIVIIFAIGFGLGFLYGVEVTLKEIAEVIIQFLDKDLDRDKLAHALSQYQGRLKFCYNQNASLYYN